jgi:hypothetical protein
MSKALHVNLTRNGGDDNTKVGMSVPVKGKIVPRPASGAEKIHLGHA